MNVFVIKCALLNLPDMDRFTVLKFVYTDIVPYLNLYTALTVDLYYIHQ